MRSWKNYDDAPQLYALSSVRRAPALDRRNNLIPMSSEKLFPSRFTVSLWYWLDATAFENIRNWGTSDDVTEIR